MEGTVFFRCVLFCFCCYGDGSIIGWEVYKYILSVYCKLYYVSYPNVKLSENGFNLCPFTNFRPIILGNVCVNCCLILENKLYLGTSLVNFCVKPFLVIFPIRNREYINTTKIYRCKYQLCTYSSHECRSFLRLRSICVGFVQWNVQTDMCVWVYTELTAAKLN